MLRYNLTGAKKLIKIIKKELKKDEISGKAALSKACEMFLRCKITGLYDNTIDLYQ
jgi:hypothetical protein